MIRVVEVIRVEDLGKQDDKINLRNVFSSGRK